MRKTFIISLCTILLTACQSVQQISIDYMVPAEINFPDGLRRVAVVNNGAPQSTITNNNTIKLITDNSKPEIITYQGNSAIATETLAEALANANYFDEVVICDSVLYSETLQNGQPILSGEQIRNLLKELDVDFLISVEKLDLQTAQHIRFIPEWNCYRGVVDMKVSPTINIYIPNRNSPLLSINARDSIFWEQLGTNESYVRSRLINTDEMMKEASTFAGTIPMKYMLPHWKTSVRELNTGGSVHMRDAAIYVRENEWEKAFQLWNNAYSRVKNKKQKMRLAYNIALYYEIIDNFDSAIEWAQKAQKFAHEIDKINERDQNSISFYDIPNYVVTTRYLEELKERKEALSKLNIQMKRIQEDF